MPKKLYSDLVKKIKSDNRENLEEKMVRSGGDELKKICENLENVCKLTSKDLIGLGTSCVVFKYDRGQVIKICSKKIKYLKECKSKSAINFQKQVANLQPYLLPMNDIIYDGKQFFVYVQDLCEPLDKKSSISCQDFTDILDIIRALFSQGLLVGQLKPKNVGYSQFSQKGSKHLTLFDYHSMHHLDYRIKDKKDWWHSLDESLICYSKLFSKNRKKKITIHSLEKFRKYIRTIKSRDIDLKKIDELLGNAKKEILTFNTS